MNLSRRSVLKTGAGAVALGTLAGCLSEPEGGDLEGAYAAFFSLWDWAEEITGEEMDFDNPVEAGEMGHGWEPDGDLTRDVANSKAFLYLDTAEFSWAQQVADNLETDHDDVVLIDAMDGLESQLLPLDRDSDADREPDTDYDFDPDDLEVAEFDVYDRRSGELAAYWHASANHWHQSIPEIPAGGRVEVDAVVVDDDDRVLPLGEDEQFQLDARVLEGANEDVLEIESRGDYVIFHGKEIDGAARTRIAFELVADGEVIWDTSEDSMTAEVLEEIEESEAPGTYDPHVWIDPVLAQDMVDTIVEGLVEIDPDNEDVYEENAVAYKEELADIDEQLQTLAADAEQDVAVFVGHDSYQYIEHRYDFEFHTLTGISPDEAEDHTDVADMIDLVEEEDIEYILYDPFEAETPGEDVPAAAQQIVDDSSAVDAVPLTPLEGTTEAWQEEGWGWIDQMEEINVPSLRKALGAE